MGHTRDTHEFFPKLLDIKIHEVAFIQSISAYPLECSIRMDLSSYSTSMLQNARKDPSLPYLQTVTNSILRLLSNGHLP